MKANYLLKTLLITLLFVVGEVIAAPLSGTYTVGAGESYETPNDAYQALRTEGIAGAVVFNIKPGTYTYNLTISDITGSSSTNTVTFQSQSGNKSDVTLQSTNSYVLYLSYCGYVNFKNLTFVQNYSTRAIYLNNTYGDISFENCEMMGYNSSSSSSTYSVIYLSSKNDNLILDNCSLSRGSYGVYASGNGDVDVDIRDCSIKTPTYPLYLRYVKKVHVENCQLEGDNYGVILNSLASLTFKGNTIKALRYGLQFYNVYSYKTKSQISNNIIEVINDRAIYAYDFSHIDIYFNTFLSSSQCIYFDSDYKEVSIKNNIFHSQGCSYLFYFNGSIDGGDINNNIYSSSCLNSFNQFYTNGGAVSFNRHKLISGKEQQSIMVDGHNIANNKPSVGILNNLGTPIVGIDKDVNGDIRNTLTPDAGALEFDAVDNKDLVLMTIDSPVSPNCSNSNEVKVTVKNVGLSKISNFELELYFNNTLTKTVTEGEILANESKQVSLGNVNLDGDNDSIYVKIKEVDGGLDDNQMYDELSLFNIYTPVSGSFTFGENDSLKGLPEFITKLNNGGACGDISILINDGNYEEEFSFDFNNVAGLNNYSITIQSTSGIKENVILNPEEIDDDGIIEFSGVKKVTIKNLTLSTIQEGCISAIYSDGFVDSVIIDNLILMGDTNNCEDVLYFDNATNNIFVTNSTISGGYYSLEAYNPSGESSVYLKNNVFSDWRYGMEIDDFSTVLIESCIFNSNEDDNQACYLYNIEDLRFQNNQVIATNSDYALYFEDINSALVVGNYFNIQGDELNYIFYSENDQNLTIANNTFTSATTKSNVAAIEVDYSFIKQIVNNIFDFSGEVAAIRIYDDNANYQIDFNNYNTNGLFLSRNSERYYSLEELKLNSSFDHNSISVDPMFQNANDFHVCNELLNNAGVFVNGLSFDIDGDARNGGAVDIGADEFSPASLNDFLVTDIAALCDGEADLIASPGATSYLWNTGETTQGIKVSSKGWYSVKVTGLCGANGTDSVSVEDLPIKSNFSIHTIYGKNVNFVSWADGAPASYLWDFGDGNTSTERNPSHSYTTFGVYNVKLTVSSACGESSMEMPISLYPVSIEEVNALDVTVYPNPSNDHVFIELNNGTNENYQVQVLDLLGNTVIQESLNGLEAKLKLNIEGLSNGLYLVRVVKGSESVTFKVVKQ